MDLRKLYAARRRTLRSGDADLLVKAKQLRHAQDAGLGVDGDKALAVLLRVMSRANQHANAGGVDVGDLGKVQLDLLGGLLKGKVDGVAQLGRVGDVDLAGHGDEIALRGGIGGNYQLHVDAPCTRSVSKIPGSKAALRSVALGGFKVSQTLLGIRLDLVGVLGISLDRLVVGVLGIIDAALVLVEHTKVGPSGSKRGIACHKILKRRDGRGMVARVEDADRAVDLGGLGARIALDIGVVVADRLLKEVDGVLLILVPLSMTHGGGAPIKVAVGQVQQGRRVGGVGLVLGFKLLGRGTVRGVDIVHGMGVIRCSLAARRRVAVRLLALLRCLLALGPRRSQGAGQHHNGKGDNRH